jgi:cold shock CspA family protein
MENQENTNQTKEAATETSKPAATDMNKRSFGSGKKIMWGVIIFIVLIIVVQIMIADKYKMQVQVIEGEKKVGVNPTTEMLDFGDLSADTSATRLITMKAGGMDTFVHISTLGGAAELVKVSENNFTMKSGDEKKIEFAMYMPKSAPKGKWYKGNVLIFKIPKFW